MNEDSQGSQAPVSGAAGGVPPEKPGAVQQSDVKSLFIQGLYGILFLIILIAAIQLYFSIQSFIGIWFSYEYIPIVSSIYYAVVVAGGIYLILAYIRSR
ncbi:MAG TPA: hypothetical protein VMS81_03145 [Methanomicrobiales archaeon]|jgi:hypothetical protein|nr:hypothetical protein [Methanomicrobiales archaeon]